MSAKKKSGSCAEGHPEQKDRQRLVKRDSGRAVFPGGTAVEEHHPILTSVVGGIRKGDPWPWPRDRPSRFGKREWTQLAELHQPKATKEVVAQTLGPFIGTSVRGGK